MALGCVIPGDRRGIFLAVIGKEGRLGDAAGIAARRDERAVSTGATDLRTALKTAKQQ